MSRPSSATSTGKLLPDPARSGSIINRQAWTDDHVTVGKKTLCASRWKRIALGMCVLLAIVLLPIILYFGIIKDDSIPTQKAFANSHISNVTTTPTDFLTNKTPAKVMSSTLTTRHTDSTTTKLPYSEFISSTHITSIGSTQTPSKPVSQLSTNAKTTASQKVTTQATLPSLSESSTQSDVKQEKGTTQATFPSLSESSTQSKVTKEKVTTEAAFPSLSKSSIQSDVTQEEVGTNSQQVTTQATIPSLSESSIPSDMTLEQVTTQAIIPSLSESSTLSDVTQEEVGTNSSAYTTEADMTTTLQQETTSNEGPSAIVNGEWTKWEDWGNCSASCGGGLKSRSRECSDPPPSNGGRYCTGPDTDVMECSVWPCPDCTQTCEGNGVLMECSYCECQDITLYGWVTNIHGGAISGVQVYHENQQWLPLAHTDSNGYYQVDDLCAENINISFVKEEFSHTTAVGTAVNGTSVQANAVMLHYQVPSFVVHPVDQARFLEHRTSFCCNASSEPEPYKYTWYHNGTEVLGIEENELVLMALEESDAGLYECKAMSLAGSAYSKTASLIVKEWGQNDTCDPDPLEMWEVFPTGCNYTDAEGIEHTRLNVGRCNHHVCVNSSYVDDGVCNNKTSFCCDAISFKTMSIECPSFTYNSYVITSCGCMDCWNAHKIQRVEGRAYGIKSDGTVVNLKFGEIYFHNKLIAYTSYIGKFSFDVPGEAPPLVVEFRDPYFNEFIATVKTISYEKGVTTYQNALLPLKPEPKFVTSGDLIQVELGDDIVGTVELPEEITYADGSPITGTAKLYTKYYDPRNMNDVLSAPVSFQSVDKDGREDDLITYGMLAYALEDENGVPLYLKGNITWTQDPDVFNVTETKDGEPASSLWILSYITGKWHEVAPMIYKTSEARRKLLEIFIVGNAPTPDLSLLQTSVVRWVFINSDQPLRREYVTHPNLCYLNIRVYRDQNYVQGLAGITVTVLTKHMSSETFTGYQTAVTSATGSVCVRTHCGSRSVAFAESSAERLYAGQHILPAGYQVTNQNENREVEIENRDWGTVLGSDGPVYIYTREPVCLSALDDDYHLRFAPLAIRAQLIIPPWEFVPLAWYSEDPISSTRKACYMKIKMIEPSYQASMIATSYQIDSTGGEYGTYITGPRSNPTAADQTNKAACVEFKCAGSVYDRFAPGGQIDDVPTFVNINFMGTSTCALITLNPLMNSTIEQIDERGFSFTAQPNINYGPDYGIYTATGTQNEMTENALKFCRTGLDVGAVDDIMDPDTNVAISFVCT